MQQGNTVSLRLRQLACAVGKTETVTSSSTATSRLGAIRTLVQNVLVEVAARSRAMAALKPKMRIRPVAVTVAGQAAPLTLGPVALIANSAAAYQILSSSGATLRKKVSPP